MVRHLREQEEIMLFRNILNIDEYDAAETTSYLEEEYRKESLEYPYTAPPFDPAAALWAAKTLNMAAQLLLYRENKPEDLASLFPAYEKEINSAAILSADLCLRFLPGTAKEMKLIDSMDPIILLLERILVQWHYSGISYPTDPEKPDLQTVTNDPCLLQLYLNRIIHYKNIKLALHPLFHEKISANLGLYVNDYWKAFNIEKQLHEPH